MLNPVPLFGVGNQGKSPPVSAQRRINLYSEIDLDSSTLKLYPTPGLSVFVDFGANATRGVYQYGDVLFVVNNLTLWEVAADGSMTNRGTLEPVTGRVDMVDNGQGNQLLIVDGSFGYIYDLVAHTFAKIADADFVAGDTCAFLNGYFIVQRADSPQFGLSDLYDGTSWDALMFATAESSPGNLVRVQVENGNLILFKGQNTEFWGESGAADFPFARIGSSAIEWGLASRWSLCKYMDSLIFLRKNRLGAVQVCVLSGYTAQVVSTPEMDYLFSTYTSESATAFTYMVSGHPMFQITFPNEDVTWVYDGLTKEWHNAQYGNAGRHRGEIQINFLDSSYVTDYESGKLYLLDQDTYTDDGQTIVREVVAKHIKTGNFLRIAQLWLEMEAGIALQVGQGSDPQVMLQISRDGGNTWGAEVWRGFGAVGEYLARAVWNRLGRARDWTFKFRITDPVKTIFIGAWARYGK
jgi:hypothetical protein